jgi:hypothetical protein
MQVVEKMVMRLDIDIVLDYFNDTQTKWIKAMDKFDYWAEYWISSSFVKIFLCEASIISKTLM